MKTIYLAHPHTEQKFGRELKHALEQLGFTVINPFAGEPRSIGRLLEDRAFSNSLVLKALRLIDSADILVGYLPYPSIGTAMEIYYAHQHSKPVYILTGAKWDLKLHPFLRRFSTAIFTHLYDLQKALRELKKIRNGHPRFYELLEEIKALHDRKNADYSKAEDPLSNFRMCEAFRIPAWKGCLVRISDKWARLVQLANKPAPAVKDEAITDTMTDLAVYSLLCRILWEEAHGKRYSKRNTPLPVSEKRSDGVGG